MINLEYKDEKIAFVNIRKNDLPMVLKWYNNVDEYMFATGIDKPLTLNELKKRYLETAISHYDFFAWLVNDNNDKIGVIKGSIKQKEKDSIWINSLLVDLKYRKNGYGRCAVDALVKYIKQHLVMNKVYVSVVEDNLNGIIFWNKIGFLKLRQMDKHIILAGIPRDIIIMYKEI